MNSDIIIAPVITEKSQMLASDGKTYVFKVAKDANKTQIKLAIESLFGVKVKSVNTLNTKAKDKEIVVVDNLELNSLKTKDVKDLIQKLELAGKVLFVTSNEAEKLYLATRNLGYCAVIMANEINVYDIVNADTLVVEEAAIKYIEEVLK